MEDFPAISGFRKPLSGDYEAEQPQKHHHIYRYAAENSFRIGKYSRRNHFRRQYFNRRELNKFRKHRKFLVFCFVYPLHGKTGRHLMEHRQSPSGFGKPVYGNYETKRDEKRRHLSRPGSQAAEITVWRESLSGKFYARFPHPFLNRNVAFFPIFLVYCMQGNIYPTYVEWEGSLCI